MNNNYSFNKLGTEELRGRIVNAATLLVQFGQIDGDHHKLWAIDQALRALTGEDYDALIEDACADGYEWDTGIAP